MIGKENDDDDDDEGFGILSKVQKGKGPLVVYVCIINT